jgi:beta-phosphoglucomutase family hydrolase
MPETGAVIFDMDGVLVDSGASHRAAWRAMLDELGVAEPEQAWRRTIGRPAHEAVSRLLGRDLSEDEARRLSELKHEHYTRLAASGLPPVRGAAAFLDTLAALGVPRALATSARRADVTRLLEPLGFLDHFAVIVAAEDVRRGKPHPEVYLRAAEGLGVAPERCLVFDDSRVGIEAARAAGMRVIAVATAHGGGELLAAGAERVLPHFEGCHWPL